MAKGLQRSLAADTQFASRLLNNSLEQSLQAFIRVESSSKVAASNREANLVSLSHNQRHRRCPAREGVVTLPLARRGMVLLPRVARPLVLL